MKRLNDWTQRLNEYIEERKDIPFAWGANDCTAFAAGAVQAMTGIDPIGDLRGQWENQSQALEIISAGGGLDVMLEQVAEKHGWTKRSAKYAQRGDIMLFNQVEEGSTLAICMGAGSFAPGVKKGLARLDTLKAIHAYHIH